MGGWEGEAEVKSGVKQLVNVRPSICPILSVYDCQFVIEEQLISIECFILNTNRKVNRKTGLPFYRTLALNLARSHMRKEERDNIFYSVCPGNQIKLSIIPNRKLTVLRML